jgi:hypothetical protein
MRKLASLFTLWVALAVLAACGPKPKHLPDGGGEDAGEDAGFDAGRPAGQMPQLGYSVGVGASDSGVATNKIGVFLAMALDQNDQPMVAYVHEDPNSGGVRQADRVEFSRWNGEDEKWQAPKTIEVCGEVDDAVPHRQVSLARDAVTGRLGVAYVTASKAVRLATSDDEGVTWSLELASAANPNGHVLGDPRLAMAGGTTHLAYWEAGARCAGAQCGTIVYRTRTDASAFTTQTAPLTAGGEGNMTMPLALALDSAGKPGLAYFVDSSNSATVTLAFWRPGAGAATAVFDSGTQADATPSVSLAFLGDKPRLAYHLNGTDPVVQLRYQAALDAAGTNWAAPVGIPRNGTVAKPETTRYFQSIAVGPADQVAIVAAFNASLDVPQMCGGPKLARSSDGTAFTVCSPDGGRFIGYAGTYASVARSSNNKLTIAFLYETTTSLVLGPGVVIWREP